MVDGRDNGAPGLRPYHPGHYGAFVLDPDDHNIEAVYRGEAHIGMAEPALAPAAPASAIQSPASSSGVY